MTELTGSLAAYADYLYNLVVSNKEALGLQDVYYGDQDNIPVTPVVCVEPDNKSRVLKRIGRGTDVSFTVYFLLYHSSIRDPQGNRRDADALAERLEELVHNNERAGGLVVTSLVTRVESGYATKTNSIMRASRLTVEADSQHRLPMET